MCFYVILHSYNRMLYFIYSLFLAYSMNIITLFLVLTCLVFGVGCTVLSASICLVIRRLLSLGCANACCSSIVGSPPIRRALIYDTEPTMPMSPAISIQERRSARPPVYPCPREFTCWRQRRTVLWSKSRAVWLPYPARGKRILSLKDPVIPAIRNREGMNLLLGNHAYNRHPGENRGPCQTPSRPPLT